MSFPDFEKLVKLGYEHRAEVTGRFIAALREHGGDRLNAMVEDLPTTCRTMAQQLVMEARYYRMSDAEIARAVVAADEQCTMRSGAEYTAWLDANGFPSAAPFPDPHTIGVF